MKCEHKNKKLTDWSFENGLYDGGFHTSVYRCLDCKSDITSIDTPIIYNYPPQRDVFKGNLLNTQDIEIILEKERLIKEVVE